MPPNPNKLSGNQIKLSYEAYVSSSVRWLFLNENIIISIINLKQGKKKVPKRHVESR